VIVAGFDQAWLAAHQAKMAAHRGEPIRPAPSLVEFSIAYPLKLPNTTNGRHWIAAHGYRKRLGEMVGEAVKPWNGQQPMERARVTITRWSIGVCDADNLVSSVKPLLDLLLVRSKAHPHSFGLIRDDDPAHVELVVLPGKAASRKEQRTDVRIERLS
jgi:hypothetical protein